MSTRVSLQIFLVSLLAGWLNREQQRVLDYLQEENRVLKEQLGGRLRFTDEQRRRLASAARSAGTLRRHPRRPRSGRNVEAIYFLHPTGRRTTATIRLPTT